MKFDMHIHSDVSDGSKSIEEIVAKARIAGLDGIAITNHDTVIGLDYAVELGEEIGLKVIRGVEISAYDEKRKRKVHILGYGFDIGTNINNLCKDIRYRRNCNSLWQLKKLIELGYEIDEVTCIKKSKKSSVLYKQHMVEELINMGYTDKLYGDLYKKLFKNNGPLERDIKYLDAKDAIKAIKDDGGIAILAHPGELDSFDIIDELVAVGLDGIEINHPSNSEKDRERIRGISKKYNLILTGGSDYHGDYGSSEIGEEFCDIN